VAVDDHQGEAEPLPVLRTPRLSTTHDAYPIFGECR
jgi:hypothetical protein